MQVVGSFYYNYYYSGPHYVLPCVSLLYCRYIICWPWNFERCSTDAYKPKPVVPAVISYLCDAQLCNMTFYLCFVCLATSMLFDKTRELFRNSILSVECVWMALFMETAVKSWTVICKRRRLALPSLYLFWWWLKVWPPTERYWIQTKWSNATDGQFRISPPLWLSYHRSETELKIWSHEVKWKPRYHV